jgi:hypothetical protein
MTASVAFCCIESMEMLQGHIHIAKRRAKVKADDKPSVIENCIKAVLQRQKNSLPLHRVGAQASPDQRTIKSLPEYVHQAVEAINIEEQKIGRPPKLDLEKKVNLYILVCFLNKSNRLAESRWVIFSLSLGLM